jgi:beta-xylosidase
MPAFPRCWIRLALIVLTVASVVATTTAMTPSAPIRPVIPHDFPDPKVIFVDGAYYAYSTASRYGAAVLHVPVRRSTSLLTGWGQVRDAMPSLPPWVDRTPSGQASIWAPAVTTRGEHDYLLYFTARSAKQRAQCLGVARSAHPDGPFRSVAERPLVCRPGDVDAIDPAPFVDHDGTRYLLYSASRAGNATIWLQRLTEEGTDTVGPRRAVLRADRPDEAHIVEAPALVRHGDEYVLFYSGNAFNSGSYFVNYATADSLCDGFDKHSGQFLNQHTLGDAYRNPGGQDVLHARRQDFLVFHAYTDAATRSMFVVGLRWHGPGRPVLELDHAARTELD